MMRTPPGPKNLFPGDLLIQFRKDPLAKLSDISRKYGDVAALRLGAEKIVVLNHPDLIREILVTQHKNFKKGRGLEKVKKFLGEGLLTSEGKHHLRQRRMMQPAFHHQRIATFAEMMTAQAEKISRHWADGQTLDVAEEMAHLTLAIVAQTLFGANVEAESDAIGASLTTMLRSFPFLMLPFSDFLEKLPLPVVRRMKKAHAWLDALIYRLIEERRQSDTQHDDLLDMLLLAQDEENGDARMSDEQVRDEAMTIFLAGHETTANALNWTWYLLSQHPEVEARLYEELDRVLSGNTPTLADLPALPYTEQIISESFRLYPPAWMIARRAIAATELGDFHIPARTIVMMSQYVMHRDSRFFPEPEVFRPERWTPEFKAALPKYAFFPFGGGPRQCIGEGFAWMETILLLATLAKDWRFRLVPGHPIIPEPMVTLRPKGGLKMIARRRT